jgi:two-component system chemotaxis response regulator CheV
MRVPPAILTAEKGGLVTAVSELADKRLLMMIDVEKVLAEMRPPESDLIYRSIAKVQEESLRTVFFADDSLVARKMVERTLETMGVRHYSSVNGLELWEALEKTASRAASIGKPTRDFVSLVITDIEMPEMDGYLLTRKIKSDPRFAGIPVVMHSSLTGESNQALGFSVGVDEYVPKMQPKQLSEAVLRYLARPAAPH